MQFIQRALAARLAVRSQLILMAIIPSTVFAIDCAPFEFQGVEAIVCRVDLRHARLRIFNQASDGRPFKYFSAVNRDLQRTGERLVFAMNAGMYHSDYSAVGLLVSDGKEQHSLNLDSAAGNFFLKPNGVFLVTEHGASVVESSRYATLHTNVELATQSGPMLVIDGAIHPAFQEDSTSRYVRNGVGVLSPYEVVFAISERPVTFHEFATLFRNGLGCKDALFLDATVSSLYSTHLDRNDVRAALGPIIGITGPIEELDR